MLLILDNINGFALSSPMREVHRMIFDKARFIIDAMTDTGRKIENGQTLQGATTAEHEKTLFTGSQSVHSNQKDPYQ